MQRPKMRTCLRTFEKSESKGSAIAKTCVLRPWSDELGIPVVIFIAGHCEAFALSFRF